MKKTFSVILSIILVVIFATTSLGITSIPIKSVKLGKSKIYMTVGETATLNADISPANATNKKLLYNTSNERIATVDEDGKITAVRVGKAAIYVRSTYKGKILAKCNVTVSGVTLKVTSWIPENRPAWEKLKVSFGKENPGAKIDFSIIAGDQYANVVKTKLLAGDGPDVYYYFGSAINADLAANGLATDLTNEPFVNRLIPFFKSVATHSDGKIYGLPVDYSAYGVFYNKAVFEKLGLKPPKDYAEFLALCSKIKAAGIEPIALGAKDSWTIINQFLPMSISLSVAAKPSINFDLFDGKVKYSDPEYKEPFIVLDELVKKEYINKGLLGINYQQSVTNLSEGKAAMIITGGFVLGTMAGINKDVKLGHFPFPAKSGDPGMFMTINQTLVKNPKGNHLGISKKLITFLAKPENMKLLCEASNGPACLKDVTPELPDALADVNKNGARYPGYVSFFAPGQVSVTLTNLLNSIAAGEGAKDSYFEQMDKQLVEELKDPKVTRPIIP